MRKKSSLVKTLNGLGFPVNETPDGAVKEPGFYIDPSLSRVVHWSHPAAWNLAMQDHGTNEHGLVEDGFQSITNFEDIDHLVTSLSVWKDYIQNKENI